jgi:hypothetical protein
MGGNMLNNYYNLPLFSELFYLYLQRDAMTDFKVESPF